MRVRMCFACCELACTFVLLVFFPPLVVLVLLWVPFGFWLFPFGFLSSLGCPPLCLWFSFAGSLRVGGRAVM